MHTHIGVKTGERRKLKKSLREGMSGSMDVKDS